MANEPEDGPLRRCLPIAEWPASDRTAWAAAHQRGGLLDDDGLAADWAPATSSVIAGGYGRFLSFLTETSDLDPTASPADRVTRPRVEAYVAHLRERNHSGTVAGRLLQLVRAMAVMAPNIDWAWLRRIHSRLRRMSTPASDDRPRLLPAATVTELYTDLVRRAERGEGLSDRTRALQFRDGAMLAIFGACGIRPKNMAALAIGTTLQRRGNEWWVAFSAPEMKNRRPYEVPLPGLTRLIDRYLEHYRPYLLSRSTPPIAGNALWLSGSGKLLSAKQVGQIITRRTERELDHDLNPRLLRKLIPTELAIHDPEHVGTAQPLLGHADDRTTQGSYNLGRALDAARRHQEVIRSIRRQSRPHSCQPGRRSSPRRGS